MNAELLTAQEQCPRKAIWSQQWEYQKLRSTEMVYRALREALTETEREDHGTVAGEYVTGLCADRGLDTPHFLVYDIGLHHAVLADILAVHLRPIKSPAWKIPVSLDGWESKCYIEGSELKRVILCDHYSEERVIHECRSWYTLGEMATYELPMTLQIIVIGQARNGKRSTPWTRGLLHPKNHSLRFARSRHKGVGFTGNWDQVWREDRAEIARDKWLGAMTHDGVLKDLSFIKHIELPSVEKMKEVRADMKTAADELKGIRDLPRKRYSVCDWPTPCQFRGICWGHKSSPEEDRAFVQTK